MKKKDDIPFPAILATKAQEILTYMGNVPIMQMDTGNDANADDEACINFIWTSATRRFTVSICNDEVLFVLTEQMHKTVNILATVAFPIATDTDTIGKEIIAMINKL